jgi:HPt (histidine-containing phosphotransfer) domain-containing protein
VVLETLRDELGDADGTILDAIVSLYLAQGQELVDRLGAAAAASDAVTLRAVAHSLRGSTLTVGGAHLAALCQRIELAGPAGEAGDAARSVRQAFEALASQLRSGRRAGSLATPQGGHG